MPKTRKKQKNQKNYGTCFLRGGRPAIDQCLTDMGKLARKIRLIRQIRNAMLSSGAYSDSNRELQIRKSSQIGNLNDNELKMVNETWDMQKLLSEELQEMWGNATGDKSKADIDKKDGCDVKEYKKKRAKKRLSS